MFYDYEKVLARDVACKEYSILKEDCKLGHAIKILLKNNMQEAIITDKENNLTGIITLTDISRLMQKKKNEEILLRECMIKNLITVKENACLLECRNIMQQNKIGILPVLQNDRVIGVIRKEEIISSFYMALEKADMKLNHVVDSLHEAVCVIDEEGRTVIWNKSAEKLYDVSASDILGKPLEDFFPDAMDVKVFKTKKPVENVYHSPKENCYIVISAAPIFGNGEFLGVVSTDWDVSEFKKLTNELERANDTVEFLRREVEKFSNDGFGKVIGKNMKLLKKIELAKQVAKAKVNILITGESGTGKEVFARAIHDSSDQKGLFVPINCSAIPSELFESELFGYEQGAFTGANKKGKMGLFEMANDGTIFLDEIGDLPMFMQAKLLRVLQDKVVRRVGGEKYTNINVRILSATNKDLKKMVEEGIFREDLYYRLDVVQIELPPLRERGRDIVLLIDYFLKELSKQNNKEVVQIDQRSIEILQNYNWKGNIRELKNTIEYLIVLCKGNMITTDLIPNYILEEIKKTKRKGEDPLDLNKSIVEFEVDMIERALKLANGKKAKAAKLLNIPRATLYYKIEQHKIKCQ
ncbi:sigma-54 dependent transcriptional regulator PrdR [Marinisporobacter balticus]|uniref:PAS domain S-box-containing protein n=1 Tax=Marinisporobacter balticus TaxID=2018667 RepID=A0A4R2KQ82_9FIRM|nr:sigma-54 dependent transcriptional regulator PrdR [Marinisporobacter balticus]TCO74837.1 PAS domain S-box-containing protein [Marinisporobacter balticus]